MTRINCVPVEELVREHLIAEYRELPRIFPLITAAYERGESPTDKRNPLEYRLGTGHVRFFYNKLEYLRQRHKQLVREMHKRNYQTNFDCSDRCLNLPFDWQYNWSPSEKALEINRRRISQRLQEMRHV